MHAYLLRQLLYSTSVQTARNPCAPTALSADVKLNLSAPPVLEYCHRSAAGFSPHNSTGGVTGVDPGDDHSRKTAAGQPRAGKRNTNFNTSLNF